MTRRDGSQSAVRAVPSAAPQIEVLETRRLLSAAATAAVAESLRAPVWAAVEAAEAESRPSVDFTTPAAGATGVDPGEHITAYVNLPNVAGVTDDQAILDANVRLFKLGSTTPVAASVNTTGGGDAIILTPTARLANNTQYRFEILEGLTDTTGAKFEPFTMTFTTGPQPAPAPSGIAFEKVLLPTASGHRFTGVTIGPDGRLYAGTMTGEIVRFDILADGNLGPATVIQTVRNNNGGNNRIITGARFDPSSTAANLVLWVSHGDGAEIDAPDWTGKVSRLSGAALGTYEDYVVRLPRSVRDHLTQQIDFGPDGALYVSQGSNNAMGAPDNAWGQRAERLLSAAILRVDTAAIQSRIAAGLGPLDVKTEDGGTYNPFASGAPVTIYATGVRNAFDLLWHSNGSLYAPTNGSAPGGNTPAGGGAPALDNVRQNEPDWLFRIRQGKYYGHPNPTRDEFVLNGGNPSSGADLFEVPAYPVGTQPDADWDPAIYNFGDNYSPNGVIEYQSGTFNGLLAGSLIVCRYSGGDDLIVLRPDASGDIAADGVIMGISGASGLADPLDLVEHRGSGNLYVVEYGEQRITLLRPDIPRPNPINVGRAVFNDPAGGGAASPSRRLSVTNTTAAAMTITGIEVVGADDSMFRIVEAPATPLTLQAGERVEVSVVFDPPSGTSLGVKTATLRLTPQSAEQPQLDLSLRGLATAGETGANEPSLQRIFELFELPIFAGDANPSTSEMVLDLADPNDAINVQTLVKAGDGPITVEVLAVFASAGTPTIRFGHYDPNSGDLTEVLTVTDSQRTVPALTSGIRTFDVALGQEFGLYTTAPRFNTTAYTQDERNTFEPVVENRRKTLFYPLFSADRSLVPDAYVVGFEEVSGSYDFQDFVAIVRNVRPAGTQPTPPLPEVTTLVDGTPVSNGGSVAFGEVRQGETGPERTFTFRNDGAATLSLSNPALPPSFMLVKELSAPTLAPGASDTIRVAMSTASAGTMSGTMVLGNNDPDESGLSIQLSGIVQEAAPPPPPPEALPPPIIIAEVSSKVPPAMVSGGKPVRGTVAVKLRNDNGIDFSGEVTVAVSVSGEGSASTELKRMTKRLKLRAQTERTLKLKIALPTSISQGTKSLSISATSDGKTDTEPGATIVVADPFVRLVAAPGAAPPSLALTFGKRATLRLPMTNEGNVPTTKGPAVYEFVVSTSQDGATPIHQHSLTNGRISLKPGASKRQPIPVTVPPGAFAPGSYFLLIRLSAELNQTNGQTLAIVPFSIA